MPMPLYPVPTYREVRRWKLGSGNRRMKTKSYGRSCFVVLSVSSSDS
jgi:hypothetical protein